MTFYPEDDSATWPAISAAGPPTGPPQMPTEFNPPPAPASAFQPMPSATAPAVGDAAPALNRFGLPVDAAGAQRDLWQDQGNAGSGVTDAASPLTGIVAGIVVGIVAASVYAGIMVAIEREFALLAAVVGIVVGWVVPTFWNRQHAGVGAVAGVIAAGSYVLASLFAIAGFNARFYGTGLGSELKEVLLYPMHYLAAYLEADGSVVLFFLFAVIVAVVHGAGWGKKG
ncbi:MAG: hypothetical protein CVT64_09160 [Actinobacteria bacterium HGW-Actinobacteria-4]|nr:MAG: hypothetical protein CVT64_09160 [Actinobacteria bacterium HGW-Actinobacteria-4]